MAEDQAAAAEIELEQAQQVQEAGNTYEGQRARVIKAYSEGLITTSELAEQLKALQEQYGKETLVNEEKEG